VLAQRMRHLVAHYHGDFVVGIDQHQFPRPVDGIAKQGGGLGDQQRHNYIFPVEFGALGNERMFGAGFVVLLGEVVQLHGVDSGRGHDEQLGTIGAGNVGSCGGRSACEQQADHQKKYGFHGMFA